MAKLEAFGILTVISIVLVVIGALNWGWIGLTSDNPISWLNNTLGIRSVGLERFIYVLVGLAGLWVAYAAFKTTGFLKRSVEY